MIIMRRTKLPAALLLVVGLALLPLDRTLARRDAERYLPVPSGDLLAHAQYRRLLEALLSDAIPVAAPPELLATFKRLAQESAGGVGATASSAPVAGSQPYGLLAELANSSASECPRELLQLCADIAGLTYEVADDVEKLVRLGKLTAYIKHFGELRVARCLGQLGARISAGLERAPERELDQIFASALGLDTSGASDAHDLDQQLFERARSFSITDLEPHQDRALMERIRKFVASNSRAVGVAQTDYERFMAYLDDRCEALREALGDELDLYNMARALERPGGRESRPEYPKVVESARFKKLNEYNRNCLELTNDKSLEL